ncbi:MAG: hypothetical protein QOI41_2061, partial [Myxococcales bacterium]|nr:hypothetical protein [Myxococcales bacterium]
MTGEPTESCARLGMWMLRAGGSTRVRGFSLSETRIATYRFAHPAQALAAIAKGGHPNAIGTIDVCFFSLKPAPPDEEEGAYGFRAIIESDAAGQAPPVAGELRDEPVSAHGRDLAPDKLLSHVVITYEDEDGAPLGTAPPPAGIARVALSRREEPPAREPDLAPMDDDTTPKPHKPPKSPPKSPPKPERRPIKTGKPD